MVVAIVTVSMCRRIFQFNLLNILKFSSLTQAKLKFGSSCTSQHIMSSWTFGTHVIRERCYPVTWSTWTKPGVCKFTKYKLQCIDAKVATICTGHIKGCKAGPRALLHALCHHALRPKKIILADFLFGGFNPNRQITKCSSPSNYPAIR